MKSDIHPKYVEDATISCSCGASFNIGTTVGNVQVEICSQCHPFYTGQSKLMDTAGRIDKFQERMKKAQELKSQAGDSGKKKKKLKKSIFEFDMEEVNKETESKKAPKEKAAKAKKEEIKAEAAEEAVEKPDEEATEKQEAAE